MKKSEFIGQIAERAEMSRAAAARALDAIFDTTSGAIGQAVRAGQQVHIPGFGKFSPKKRAARKGKNPLTGAEIDIPERTTLNFSPAKGMRESLSGEGGGGSTTQRASGGSSRAGAKSASGGSKSATKSASGGSKSATKSSSTSGARKASSGGATGGSTAKKSASGRSGGSGKKS